MEIPKGEGTVTVPTTWELDEPADLPRRRVDHPGAGARVYLPQRTWRDSLELLREYASEDSERMVLWSGVVGRAAELLVRTIVVPDHEPQGWRVDINRSLWRGLLHAMRRQDQMLLAQVHSHPGEAYHSEGDEAWPAEHSDGFLSVVVPRFGVDVTELTDCAIYEYRLEGASGRFHELSEDEVEDRFFFEHEIVRAVDDAS